MALKRINIYFNEEEEIDLYEAIADLAKQDKRSINAQMKVLLAEAVAARRTKERSQ